MHTKQRVRNIEAVTLALGRSTVNRHLDSPEGRG
jgi:hypothetical protein